TTIVNAADLTIRGVEAAGTLTPFDGLTFGGSVGYVEVKTDRIYVNPALLQVLGSAIPPRPEPTSVAVQGQPTWTVNANMTADFPDDMLGGRPSMSIDYHYNSSYQSIDVTVPGWSQFDIRAGISGIGGTGLSIFAY